MITNWDNFFMTLAFLVAMKSKDKSTKVGAVIVDPRTNSVLSMGYNGLPRGVDDEIPERHERPEKYHWFEHAERNAIYNANGVRYAKMYTQWMPCTDCARGIIQAGISEVVIYQSPDNLEGQFADRWREAATRTIDMFEEASVVYRFYNPDISGPITTMIYGFQNGQVIDLQPKGN